MNYIEESPSLPIVSLSLMQQQLGKFFLKILFAVMHYQRRLLHIFADVQHVSKNL